jgi:formylglycine-generating enzyme required for sulfatase activity
MGSPEEEVGRFDKEGPQHPVTLTQGFWLFDTPVTQELWEAVMGSNPSRLKSSRRPVENISWNDANEFLQRANQEVPGLNLELPSEAQWEYACRAGTLEATYAGDLEILGARNAPVLDPIAWYGGNSGQDFDLKNGWDSSDWPEKQYPHKLAGTREVGDKLENPWGLFDMLGNVWEWCRDGVRDYRNQAETDPVGSLQDGSQRMVRGGAWNDFARYVRAASRRGHEPDLWLVSLGFRCCQVQDSGEGRAITA